MFSYQPTPIQEIKDALLLKHGLRVFIKREDLNHPYVTGNKWWKLKYNLAEAIKQKKDTLLTFGGAYSNHIYATAAAAMEVGMKCIGVVRGEETLPLNPTLSFAVSCGMQLHYVSREDYRKKNNSEFVRELQNLFGDFYLIPEGGTNELAVKGVIEFAHLLEAEFDFDYCCLPVGTGGTMAGMISGLSANKNLLGFSALKSGDFLIDEIKKYLQVKNENNWQLITDYHFGGYAKTTNALLQFMHDFKERNHISLDFIYTAKMMYGLYDLIRKEKFKKGSVILCVHTGGMQGNLSLSV
jgi:1-aminocyclopropane-1-carboxylate deaminase